MPPAALATIPGGHAGRPDGIETAIEVVVDRTRDVVDVLSGSLLESDCVLSVATNAPFDDALWLEICINDDCTSMLESSVLRTVDVEIWASL